ncbi:hypothetical protein AGOR_G00002450 [Albula goreensis]|uniref:Protein regulator of cytokinesis 1 n=1 Tax=Albula goreensis TaxID=1534307 RepID=A0A8T3E4K0_9TELE|nr:hypothetical protein AGOR_G00002450 [Albula goreensis]
MRKSEVLAAESVACLNMALCRLKDIWEEIGIPEDQRLQRTDVVKKHVKGLLDMMIQEEENLRERLMKSIEKCRKELNILCKELQLPPSEEEEGSSMLQLDKDMRTRLEVLKKQKSQRMQELKALREQEQDLCDILCTDSFSLGPNDAVPSLQQLKDFHQHVASLTAEKGRRHCEFVDIKKQIILCMEDLEQLPETSFEKDVVCEDEEAFCLSTENIAALRLLLGQLEERKVENEKQCASYRHRIQQLWDRLQICQEERDRIAPHMTHSKKRDLEALQEEVTRLEELKVAHIRDLIEGIRAEMASYWAHCFLSAEEQEGFLPYHSDDFTEDLLAVHDAELLRLKQHYEAHRELFEGVQRWQDSWDLFIELEKKATDPSRFTNRGGNLLKEEKQRTDLLKSLPKLEKRLKVQLEAWEREQGREFLVQGQKFMQFVEEQWELHRIKKEREKQERHLKKSRQTEEDMLYGTAVRTPSKRRLPGNNTPGKTRKGPPARTPSRPGRPPRAGLLERNKENIIVLNGTGVGGASRTPSTPQRNVSINSVASTYSEFVKEFANLESTLVSSGNSQKCPNQSVRL